MPRLPEPDISKLSEEEFKAHIALMRLYAEFHRKLGRLLEDLTAREQVLWAGQVLEQQMGGEEARHAALEVGHELYLDGGEETVKNVYHKAVYLTRDASPYRPVINDLRRVQHQAMALTGGRASL